MRKKGFPKTESSSSLSFPINSRNMHNSFIHTLLHKADPDSEISARSLLWHKQLFGGGFGPFRFFEH
jgi:hypothetical protein